MIDTKNGHNDVLLSASKPMAVLFGFNQNLLFRWRKTKEDKFKYLEFIRVKDYRQPHEHY